LITGAQRELLVNVSELRDPAVTRAIIESARSGVECLVQVRVLDPESRAMLDEAMAELPNLHVEDVMGWDPRPHFNLIVADNAQAYVGTAYLWPTQQSMVHHGRSFENGVLMQGTPVESLVRQLGDLRGRATGPEGAS
jgi:hypothetical protein